MRDLASFFLTERKKKASIPANDWLNAFIGCDEAAGIH